MRPEITCRGYPRVVLFHKDGIKTNNHYLNLEYLTQADNNRHAAQIGLAAIGGKHSLAAVSDKEAREIFILRQQGVPYKPIRERFGVTDTVICHIATRRHYRPATEGITLGDEK